MSPENPVLVLAVMATIFGTAIAELATSAPGPGEPTFPTVMIAFGALAGTAWHFLTTRSREGAQERAFIFSMVTGGVGMAVYLSLLLASLF